MKQGFPWQLRPLGLAMGLVLGLTGQGLAADRHVTRTYAYVAPVYDDIPTPVFYAAIVPEGVPTVRERRGYGYALAPEPRFRARGTVYGYGPTYGYVAEPVETVLVERDNRPLGVYAPETRETLSEPRRYFRALTRQSGGN